MFIRRKFIRMHNFYPYVLLLTGTVLSQKDAIPNPSPPLGCEAMLCPTNTVCCYVAACATCPAVAQCVPISKVDQRADNICQQLCYSQAILLNKKTFYRQLRCTKTSVQCPQGGVCVGTYKGKRVCCRNQTYAKSQPSIDQPSTNQTSLSAEKPGDCPQNISICGGTMCENDSRCPGTEKCCPTRGSKICSHPIFKCGDSECKPGEICVQKPYPCAKGMACIQIVIETCVPAGCGKCEYNEDCLETSTGYECIPPVD